MKTDRYLSHRVAEDNVLHFLHFPEDEASYACRASRWEPSESEAFVKSVKASRVDVGSLACKDQVVE